jgi:hypothetical protein
MPEKIRIEVDDRRLVALILATKGKRPMRIVADGVEYGAYQELGTSRIPPHPFMKPAAEAVRPGYVKAMGQVQNWPMAEQVTEKAARDVERIAKQRAPVDTGALRASIHVVKGRSYTVEFESMRR